MITLHYGSNGHAAARRGASQCDRDRPPAVAHALSHLGTVGSELLGLSGGYEEAGFLEGSRVLVEHFSARRSSLHGRLVGSADERGADRHPPQLRDVQRFAGNPV